MGIDFDLSYDTQSSIKLRQEFDDWFRKGVVETGFSNDFWSSGEYELVGHGKQTNDKCGKFKKFMGCLNVEVHNAVRWFYPDLKKDSVYVRSIYHSCDKPTCPKCFKYGWAVRQATRMERRLNYASKRFGLVEHIVISVPKKEYCLSLEALRKKAVIVMRNRGVVGGVYDFSCLSLSEQAG